MDGINGIKDTILIVLAGVGSVLANLFGGWDMSLKVLLFFMGADYGTGLIVGGVFKNSPKSKGGRLESRAGLKGLFRKGGILLVVVVGALLDKLTGANYIRTAVCLFFIANEALSILENLGLMGVPLPAFLKNMLEAMKDKSGSGKTDEVSKA